MCPSVLAPFLGNGSLRPVCPQWDSQPVMAVSQGSRIQRVERCPSELASGLGLFWEDSAPPTNPGVWIGHTWRAAQMGFPVASPRLTNVDTCGKKDCLGISLLLWRGFSLPCRNPGKKQKGWREDTGNANTTAKVREPTWQCYSRTILGEGLKKLKTNTRVRGDVRWACI